MSASFDEFSPMVHIKLILKNKRYRDVGCILLVICLLVAIKSFYTAGGYLDTLYTFARDPDNIILPGDLEGKFKDFDNVTGSPDIIVPDIVHYILFDIEELNFITFFSMVSVLKIHKPEKLYIHTNQPPIRGKFFDIIQEIIRRTKGRKTEIVVMYLSKPIAVNSLTISCIQHSSDIARITILMKYGGIYIDTDEIILKPLHRFQHYEMALGWIEGHSFGTQILIAHRDARFLRIWLNSYQHYKPLRFYYNAGGLPTSAILLKYPELVHRETEILSVTDVSDLWTLGKVWTAWKKYYSVHLSIRWPPANELTINENTIFHLNCSASTIAKMIFFEIEPKFVSNSDFKLVDK